MQKKIDKVDKEKTEEPGAGDWLVCLGVEKTIRCERTTTTKVPDL